MFCRATEDSGACTGPLGPCAHEWGFPDMCKGQPTQTFPVFPHAWKIHRCLGRFCQDPKAKQSLWAYLCMHINGGGGLCLYRTGLKFCFNSSSLN